ncbi:MAG TPA: cbb3-type cytochrome c oxidase subunit I [Oligoflexus sp.]|uniref:cbb3-type cytochrome c oxidase subunit I n=1 Tax=Oligoflexus sp. TaxID=1971216 RepID=UPI002D2D637B|nr:cbb3-type cytochrome c oxidase subunit I [Oligoflexus sp.]HYX32467.1 cbb3-type cytochrome c oxidase subunit I [Oligoflexus sp.]
MNQTADPTHDTKRHDEFERVWTEPEGIGAWFATVNNQPFGNRFMVSALVFFLLAGIMALLMRLQLAVPDNNFMGPETYNRLFTMHGATMMFLVILPFIEGFAIYLLPQFVGSREMAFPRMSAFSFWVFLSGGLIFFMGFLFNAVPDVGWFVYAPLSLESYSGLGVDFLLVGLGFIEIAGVGTGIEIVTTILKLRGPGMSLGRVPLFAWTWLVTGVMIIIAFATLFGATVLIEFDRAIGTKFFVAEAGGNPVLWQHLFWFFGHPDVYIMFLPATGFVSMILPTFARRPLAGYSLVVVAVLMTGFLSFGLWAHHMFTTGMPVLASGFFAAASIMIGLASGVQVFAWIATLWRSGAALTTPMLFIVGFFFIFVLGGLTGVMVAVLPFDLQAHDTYFVVAHFHYVLIGGVIFPILAAIHYWLPLITGYMANEKLGRWSFWLIFAGFNLTFFPMHISGLLGMSRRVYTYSANLGIGELNMLSTVASFVLGVGFVLVVLNVFYFGMRGRKAVINPWGGKSLEWSGTVDMPNYVFLKPRVICNREPLDDADCPKPEHLVRIANALEGQPSGWRATLVTDAITGEPQAIQRVAGPSYIPVVAASGIIIMSVATLFKGYIVAAVALIFTLGVVCYWLWPRSAELEKMRKSDISRITGLPVEPTGTQAVGWWAMTGTLTVIAVVFGVLFFSYFYLRVYSPQWPQGNIPLPGLLWPGLGYGAIVLSGLPFLLAQKRFRKRQSSLALLIGCGALALITSVVILLESVQAEFTPQLNAYASLFHTITWHMVTLVLMAFALLVSVILHLIRSGDEAPSGTLILHQQITALFWYFTIVVTALVFATLYLSPRFF